MGILCQPARENFGLDSATASHEDRLSQTDGACHLVSLFLEMRWIHTKGGVNRSTILIGYVQFTAIFSIPLRAQIVDLNTPVKAGLRLLPLVASTAVGSLIGGGSSAKKNLTFYTMSIGTAFVILGSGLLSSLPADGHPVTAQYGYEVLLGLGLGMAISTATFMNSLEVEFEDHGN